MLKKLLVPSLLAVCCFCIAPAKSDLVSPYGGETAPSFAEISVLADRVRVSLEIDLSDYPYFVGFDDGTDRPLSERTGETFAVEADGVSLTSELRMVDVRTRQQRATAATALVPPRPRSDEVIFAELEFPFEGQPQEITLIPPLDEDGMPQASVGLIVDHLGVPVTDYRHLSQSEVLLPNWEDPWFSNFENPNLTRHHKSPLMSFISVEPREVRHEIIVRLRDLEDWTEFALPETDVVQASHMEVIEPAVAAFLSAHNPMIIDDEQASPQTVTVSRIAVGAAGLRILGEAEIIDRETGLLGVVLSYPRPALAQRVAMTWELFPDGMDAVPVTLTDPAGGVPAVAWKTDQTVFWNNHLKSWQEPVTSSVVLAKAQTIEAPFVWVVLSIAAAVAVCATLHKLGVTSCVTVVGTSAAVAVAGFAVPVAGSISFDRKGALAPELAHDAMLGLLDNASIALLETTENGFERALLPFVADDHVQEVGPELRRGLTVTLPSGALARLDKVLALKIDRISEAAGADSAQILVTWTSSASGGHWGHAHRQQITFRGLFDISHDGEAWSLDDLTILSAQQETQ